MAVFFFGLVGVGFLGIGAIVIGRAPDVTREMGGILLLLCGIVSLGFGAVLAALNREHGGFGN